MIKQIQFFKNSVSPSFCSLLLISGVLFFSACKTSKPIPYLQGQLDSSAYSKYVIPDPIVQKGDILSIVIYSDNIEATAIFNQAGTASASSGTASAITTSTPTYLVDNDGNIRLHAIGLVHAEGLTKKELDSTITSKLKSLQALLNPYCAVRFTSFKITVLGEVNSQGVFTMANEQANVLEAIGLAGGITDYGRKDNVLIMREDQGKREYAKLDLTQASAITSPFFFLKQNDVLIVDADPRKETVIDQKNLRNLTIALSIISTVALLANLALRF
ncbi:polysaccharide biosynthesis/export family protein [Pollutibacter soli]|uniref:polysaccharide biosynthesis/export family protein n=1 Tax=Pollutibacter soli TaxID=3034157 RepID=UPI00301355D8